MRIFKRKVKLMEKPTLQEFMCFLSKYLITYGNIRVEEINFTNCKLEDLTVTIDKDEIAIYK